MEEITGRISTLEGKVSEHDRIFDMIKIDITNERIDDTNKRIEGMDRRLKGKMDSNFKWMLGNSDCDVDNDNKCNSFTLNLFFQKGFGAKI